MQEYVEDEDYGDIEVSRFEDAVSLEQDLDIVAINHKNLPALIEALNKIMQETN